jgi:hypothetical protein
LFEFEILFKFRKSKTKQKRKNNKKKKEKEREYLGYNPQATTWSAWAVMPRPLRERFTCTSEWSLNGPSQFGPTGRLFSLFLFKQILDVHKYILKKKLKFQIGINFEFGTKKFKFGINFKLEQILDWNKF